MVEGRVTRGTTGVNRLRRSDRFIAGMPQLHRSSPLVVDLGFGANATTTLELWERLHAANPGVRVVGVEIEPDRIRVAEEQLAHVRAGASRFAPDAAVQVVRGGFEVPLPGGGRADVIRAMNVLRQYDEDEVPEAWARMLARVSAGGALVDGTCDELGRIGSWIVVEEAGPVSLTVALRLNGLELPGIVAERLPKALIHRNVPGEPVHAFLTALDKAWRTHAGLGAMSPTQRWLATVSTLRAEAWPVLGTARRWRLGELTVAWSAVRPN